MVFRSVLAAVLSCAALATHAALTVSTDFESGSARVLALNPETQELRISPAGDPARGMPNWWFLRVDHVDPGKPLLLEVVARVAEAPQEGAAESNIAPLNPGWTLPARAAISTNGLDWFQSSPGKRHGSQSLYQIETGATSLWIALAPPFPPRNATALIQDTARAHPFAKPFTLATSREGRPVVGLQISEGAKPSSQRPAVFVTARQHAWEVGGTWVAAGLIEWATGPDPEAQWLRRNAELLVVPLMDVDHVATGDGGKNAEPQDHNRDWSDAPHWPEVAAAQKRIRELAQQNRLAVFLDVHDPSPGATLQTFYVQHPPYVSDAIAAAQEQFLSLAKSEFGEIKRNDGTPSKPADLPVWKRISTPWVCEHGCTNTIAFTFETPWNIPRGTPAGYRDVGAKLGRATARYLAGSP